VALRDGAAARFHGLSKSSLEGVCSCSRCPGVLSFSSLTGLLLLALSAESKPRASFSPPHCSTLQTQFSARSDPPVRARAESGLQENDSNHYQDIALRRNLLRLGRVFEGDHLVEVRAKESEGFRFQPGQVAFHLPHLIVKPHVRGWWLPGSVEAFWQSRPESGAGAVSAASVVSCTVHLQGVH